MGLEKFAGYWSELAVLLWYTFGVQVVRSLRPRVRCATLGYVVQPLRGMCGGMLDCHVYVSCGWGILRFAKRRPLAIAVKRRDRSRNDVR
jgi:hypothetical protein